MPVASGLVLKDQPVLPVHPARLVANLKDESLGLLIHQGTAGILKTIQERSLDVAGVADVNPLARIRDSAQTRRLGCVGADAFWRKGPRSDMAKRHSLDLLNTRSRGMHVQRSAVSLFSVELCDGAIPVGFEFHFNESEPFGLTAHTV